MLMYYIYADTKLENTSMSFPHIMPHNHRVVVWEFMLW